MIFITLYSEKLVYEFNIKTCKLVASKHFRNTWMRKWGWDYVDLRCAIRDAYEVQRAGKHKYEAYTRKKGGKKIIIVYHQNFDSLFVITGGEGH